MKTRGYVALVMSLCIAWTAPGAAAGGWFVSERADMRVISNDSAATAAVVLADAERFQAAMQQAAGV
jgi:hypothetical protein